MRTARGFTLIEMMVVIIIIGILGVLGFPAMTRMLSSQAVRSTTYDLFADLVYARSEAITRGTTVTITSPGSTNWKQGWNIVEAAGGTTLRSQPAIGSKILMTGPATISFERTGRATNAAAVQFDIRPDVTSETNAVQDNQRRCVKLDPSGRPRSYEGVCGA